MSRARVDRLAAAVSALVAKRMGESAVPLAVKALQDAGYRVCLTWDDGLSVNEAPGLDDALAALEARGVRPGLVAVIRDLGAEAEA